MLRTSLYILRKHHRRDVADDNLKCTTNLLISIIESTKTFINEIEI